VRSNDVELRAYANCPEFIRRVHQLYKSSWFAGLRIASRRLLEKLAERPEFAEFVSATASGDVTNAEAIPKTDGKLVPKPSVLLEEAWNCYDAINVARAECHRAGDTAERGGFNADTTAAITTTTTTTTNGTSATSATSGIGGNASGAHHACDSRGGGGTDTLATFLTDEEWVSLRVVAHSIEHRKYTGPHAGSLVGHNLLSAILKRMGGAESGAEGSDANADTAADTAAVTASDVRPAGGAGEKEKEPTQKFVLYSGHYPNILSILAALRAYGGSDNATAKGVGVQPQVGRATLPPLLANEIIPDYAAALIFERYHHPEAGGSVRVLVKEGGADEAAPLVLGGACGGGGGGRGMGSGGGGGDSTWCSLDAFGAVVAAAAPVGRDTTAGYLATIGSAGTQSAAQPPLQRRSWCTACQNTVATSCSSGGEDEAGSKTPHPQAEKNGGAIAGGFVGGAAFGAVVGLGAVYMRSTGWLNGGPHPYKHRRLDQSLKPAPAAPAP
jgi:hypothetical protein